MSHREDGRFAVPWYHAEVEFDPTWPEALRCGHCGGNCLHQGAVRVYDRHEDEAETSVTTVAAGGAQTDRRASASTRNPSDRRHGLTIAFACEFCASQLELTIAQHKGHTLLGWRYRPPLDGRQREINEIFYPSLRSEPDRLPDPGIDEQS